MSHASFLSSSSRPCRKYVLAIRVGLVEVGTLGTEVRETIGDIDAPT